MSDVEKLCTEVMRTIIQVRCFDNDADIVNAVWDLVTAVKFDHADPTETANKLIDSACVGARHKEQVTEAWEKYKCGAERNWRAF